MLYLIVETCSKTTIDSGFRSSSDLIYFFGGASNITKAISQRAAERMNNASDPSKILI